MERVVGTMAAGCGRGKGCALGLGCRPAPALALALQKELAHALAQVLGDPLAPALELACARVGQPQLEQDGESTNAVHGPPAFHVPREHRALGNHPNTHGAGEARPRGHPHIRDLVGCQVSYNPGLMSRPRPPYAAPMMTGRLAMLG